MNHAVVEKPERKNGAFGQYGFTPVWRGFHKICQFVDLFSFSPELAGSRWKKALASQCGREASVWAAWDSDLPDRDAGLWLWWSRQYLFWIHQEPRCASIPDYSSVQRCSAAVRWVKVTIHWSLQQLSSATAPWQGRRHRTKLLSNQTGFILNLTLINTLRADYVLFPTENFVLHGVKFSSRKLLASSNSLEIGSSGCLTQRN